MAQHYSNPNRENNPHALPDVETFEARFTYCPDCQSLVMSPDCRQGACNNPEDGKVICGRIVRLDKSGWFYWFCLPGCLPDSEPFGPFESEAAAIEDARENADDDLEGL